VSVIQNFLLATPEGYQISRSVRLRSSASAYLSRTLTTPTNNKIWTWSAWVKRGRASGTSASAMTLFATGSASTDAATTELRFDNERLVLSGFSTNWLISNAVYRDPSAWYHIVVAWDNSNATASNRIKIYVNGLEISYATDNRTSLSTTATYGINQAVLHTLGAWSWNNGSFAQPQYYDGYLTEINFIDGQALTPASFGETDAVTGVWQPKKYTGTYGTNGFYLNFSDPSAATAAAIGKDYSGNGNNWTPNNISVTSGATYDSMLDVPTQWADGGNGRGNYATLNPINKALYQPTISDGNLRVTPTTTQYQNVFSTISQTSGKWYCEVTVNGTPNSANMIGVSSATEQNYLIANAGLIGGTSSGYGYYIYNGNKYNNGSSSAYGNSIASGDVVGIALDLDNGKVWFSKNGTWQASGDPAAGTNAAFTSLTSSLGFFISSSSYSGGATSFDHNFGQRPFAFSAPSGFRALNTQNLPTPTILKGNQYFDVSTWSGTGGSSRSITGVNFQPDLVWGKVRNTTYGHMLFDSVRGAGSLKELGTNVTGAEGYASSNLYGFLSAFNSDGFTVTAGTDGTIPNAYWNQSGNTYVGWQWKEGATQGFDIVTYTGNGAAGRTISHSLGVTPAMMILKSRSNSRTWAVYHKNLTSAAYYLGLETTNQQLVDNTMFNSTAPTSSVFSVGTYQNANTENYVAYLFAEVAGFSKFGSYTGNGSADGPFVFLGLRARYLLIKRTDSTGSWYVYDTARKTYNTMNEWLQPNTSNAENSGTTWEFDILSNGFKVRNSGAFSNASGATYIFAAFAENPFKNALAR
jgi:hypothetical protein